MNSDNTKEAKAVEVPMGAIVNGRVLADRLEATGFECVAGDLRMCSDWQEFRRCFEHLAEWAQHFATPQQAKGEQPSVEVVAWMTNEAEPRTCSAAQKLSMPASVAASYIVPLSRLAGQGEQPAPAADLLKQFRAYLSANFYGSLTMTAIDAAAEDLVKKVLAAALNAPASPAGEAQKPEPTEISVAFNTLHTALQFLRNGIQPTDEEAYGFALALSIVSRAASPTAPGDAPKGEGQ